MIPLNVFYEPNGSFLIYVYNWRFEILCSERSHVFLTNGGILFTTYEFPFKRPIDFYDTNTFEVLGIPCGGVIVVRQFFYLN